MNRDLPYLPGLDGLRGLAVIAVMVYHADSHWLPGGFLGVEVFFVVSGYLITSLLLDEHDRRGRISLSNFYARRARRLLPPLFAMLLLLAAYTAFLRRDALGQLRGDALASLTYISNWYQIWIGQSYTATGDFVPLRHLWSLAVEEQFYLVWPLVMIGLLRMSYRSDRVAIGQTFGSIAMAIAAFMALAHRPGPIGTCEMTPAAYWELGGHCISRIDVLYLSTPTRCGGLLLGAALAMMWRQVPAFSRQRPFLEVAGVLGLLVLGVMIWNVHVVTSDGPDPWLFQGGFLVTGFASVAVVLASTRPTFVGNRVLGVPVLVWIGLRSYGLYLFHWPIYQAIRRVSGNALTVDQFVVAVALTLVITELSYRLLETPIRSGAGLRWRPWLAPGAEIDRRLTGMAIGIVFVFALISLAGAPVRQNEIAMAQEQAEQFVGDPFAVSTTSAVSISLAASTLPETAQPAFAPTAGPTTGPTSPPTPAPTPAPTPPVPPPTAAATAPPAPPSTSPQIPPATPPATAPPAAPATAPLTQPALVTVAPGPAVPAAVPPPPGAPVGRCEATPIERYALGDSVMVGAAEHLSSAGFCVDAVQSRFFDEGVERVVRLRLEGRLGRVVVVALGTNGLIDASDLERMMLELAAVPRVVVVTAKADRTWVAPGNELLRALPARYPNVVVVDWELASAACPGMCFWADGIHLRPDGRAFYTELIVAATG